MYKIALVNPPQNTNYSQPPMGLATIAGVLEENGYRVSVVDANALKLSPEEVTHKLNGVNIIGITAMTPTINAAIKIIREIKKGRPDVPVILGGAHASLLPEETMKAAPEIDFIVNGEGEKTAVELVQALEKGQPIDAIQGISYRKDSRIVRTPPREINGNLDSLPYLAYHLLPWQSYKPHPPHGRALPFTAIITSRGCPYHCSYCSKPVFGTGFRAQSPGRVVDEIVYYKEKFGINELAFYDDVFTLDKKRAYAISEEIIRRGIKLYWTCETRVNLVDEDLLKIMKKAGCYAIAYGVESAAPEILETISKGLTLEQIESAVRLTHQAGIQTIGYFMIGSPGETPATIRKTIDFSRKLKLDFAQFAMTTPFPGTELYNIYMKEIGKEIPWENFVYGGTGGKVTPLFESADLSKDDLNYWMRRAYGEFYLRPSYIWQRITRIRSLRDILVNIKGFFMLLESIKPDRQEKA